MDADVGAAAAVAMHRRKGRCKDGEWACIVSFLHKGSLMGRSSREVCSFERILVRPGAESPDIWTVVGPQMLKMGKEKR